jgi:methylated-DNA-[protein]-cysteine S-methyltransferase
MAMAEHALAFFDTAIGHCGIAWSGGGVEGVQLPEGSRDATAARCRRRFPGAREVSPPPEIQTIVEGIGALLRGERADLSSARLDMAGVGDVDRRVYEAARAVPAGATATYGDIARRVGPPATPRSVGQSLGRNPFPIVVPCHRILGAGGRLVGFSASGGVTTKLRLLSIEGSMLPLFAARP